MAFEMTLEPVAPTSGPAAFHDLMASVGYLLFQWSLLDQTLEDEISYLRHATGDTVPRTSRVRTVNERLAEWRALLCRGRRRAEQLDAIDGMCVRLQDLHRLRNLIATGLIGASNQEPAPLIRCTHARTHGQDVRFGMADLADIIDEMESCRINIPLLRDGEQIPG